jgi:hypothetical protein
MMLQASCAELTIVSDGQQAVDAYNEVHHTTLCNRLTLTALSASVHHSVLHTVLPTSEIVQ